VSFTLVWDFESIGSVECDIYSSGVATGTMITLPLSSF
jgi:hypothetical protein